MTKFVSNPYLMLLRISFRLPLKDARATSSMTSKGIGDRALGTSRTTPTSTWGIEMSGDILNTILKQVDFMQFRTLGAGTKAFPGTMKDPAIVNSCWATTDSLLRTEELGGAAMR